MKDLNELFAGGNLETEQDMTVRINEITSLIQDKYPELLPYIAEIPVTVPSDPTPQVNNQILKDYYDSLYQIVKNHENKSNNEL
ncbi:MAG TPA: hypothetical protein VK172_04785 [Lentimicrobium sp.]|jgi:hypothetical protein|nr:hypothetical protein [Lentimicrobium sp.]